MERYSADKEGHPMTIRIDHNEVHSYESYSGQRYIRCEDCRVFCSKYFKHSNSSICHGCHFDKYIKGKLIVPFDRSLL